MAITLKWAPQSGLDSIEIYRGNRTLTSTGYFHLVLELVL